MALESPSVAAAMALWPHIRQAAGLKDGPWQLRALKADEQAKRSQSVILAVDGTQQIIMKHQRAPIAPDYVEAMFQNCQEAYDAFPADAKNAIAQPLFFDRETQTTLTAFVPGQSVADLLDFGGLSTEQQLTLVTRVGRWLAQYHRARGLDRTHWNGKWHIAHFEEQFQRCKRREIDPPARVLLMAHLERAAQIARDHTGKEVVRSTHHGDFHAGNLIVDGPLMTGIDLIAARRVPVAMDLGKFLFHHFLMAPEFDGTEDEERKVPGPRLLPARVRAAMAEGYDVIGIDTPLVEMALIEYMSRQWLSIPKAREDRRKSDRQRLSALRRRSRALF